MGWEMVEGEGKERRKWEEDDVRGYLMENMS